MGAIAVLARVGGLPPGLSGVVTQALDVTARMLESLREAAVVVGELVALSANDLHVVACGVPFVLGPAFGDRGRTSGREGFGSLFASRSGLLCGGPSGFLCRGRSGLCRVAVGAGSIVVLTRLTCCGRGGLNVVVGSLDCASSRRGGLCWLPDPVQRHGPVRPAPQLSGRWPGPPGRRPLQHQPRA